MSDTPRPMLGPTCGARVFWWEGEYEGECQLPEGHEGDHYDGVSWYNDASEDTTDVHGVAR